LELIVKDLLRKTHLGLRHQVGPLDIWQLQNEYFLQPSINEVLLLNNGMVNLSGLVRCAAGWNRSGLVTALVLMKNGYKPEEAINLIRDRKSPHALCNADFVRYLENLTVGSNV